RDAAAAQTEVAQARALLPRTTQPALRAGLLACEAELHEYAGQNARAIALLDEAVGVAQSAGDDETLADTLFRRGYLRGVLGEYALGFVDLRTAVQTYERLQMPHQVQNTTNGIATLYNRMGDYAQARHYYEASLKVQKAAGLTRDRAVTQYNLGRVLENLQEWDAAQRAFEDVLITSRQLGYVRGEAYALRGLASVRNALNAPAEALALLSQAMALQQQAPDERLRAQILLQQGIALRGLNRAGESVAVLQQALQVFRKAGSLIEQSAAHGELARSLVALGDWRGAHEQQVLFKTTSDSLLTRQLDQRFATLKIEFDTAGKEKENALLQRGKEATERALAQEKRATTLQAIVLVLVVLLAVVLGMLAWRHHRTSRAMHQLAMTDELTGLPNRRHVLARLEAMLGQKGGCALLIADIDHFKSINDECGHLAGDDILRAVADVLRDGAREPVALGRLGGEEFVLALPGADEEAACHAAERLLAQVRALAVDAWLPGRTVTISIGITVAVADDTVSRMLRRADQALYAAKAGGRDRAVVRPAQADAAATAVAAVLT
ncbi:MAG TPA: diguanylate cyclase, partial [Burkholderiaceae bacterium]|nr:diguanylate cyclase [Burkholderiaceae bacterium]